MTATNPAIEVAGLKSYGDHTVLDGVDLTVSEGTVYALLGPNGAGKTTIVNILSTLLIPGDGEIRVAGSDVRREPADLSHLDRATAATTVTVMLERFDLVDAADRRAQTYSGGMKRRLDLAMTLIARPRLTWRIDPAARAALETEIFGKRLLVTDHAHWSISEVVAGYRSQNDVESGFRHLKDPHVVGFSPMFPGPSPRSGSTSSTACSPSPSRT